LSLVSSLPPTQLLDWPDYGQDRRHLTERGAGSTVAGMDRRSLICRKTDQRRAGMVATPYQ
jgi:hypothetical protein